MEKKLLLLILLFCVGAKSFSQTNIKQGAVYGTWEKNNSPYLVNGDITIPNDSSLVVKPGTEIRFLGHYKFNVKGRLLALGKPDSLITFCSYDTTGFYNLESVQGSWHGIRFDSTLMANDSSILSYCIIRDGKALGEKTDRLGGALYINLFSKLKIEHCLIFNNYASGYANGEGVIFASNGQGDYDYANFNVVTRNNMIYDNWSNGLSFYFAAPIVTGNFIMNNKGYGVVFIQCQNSVFINNLVYNNSSGVVHEWNNRGIINTNNTIVFNREYGVTTSGDVEPIIYLYNNIIWGNTIQIGEDFSSIVCENCVIQEGEYTQKYNNNQTILTGNPAFTNDPLHPFSISPSSSCYDKGDIADYSLIIPSTDIANNNRIFNGKIDIGAYECQKYLSQVFSNNDELQFYPNPTSCDLIFNNPKYINCLYRIIDINGEVIEKKILNERNINVANLSSGIYIIEIQGENDYYRQKFIVQ